MISFYSDTVVIDNNATPNIFDVKCITSRSTFDDSLIKMQNQIKSDLHFIDTIKW
jgi:hypothetical protein